MQGIDFISFMIGMLLGMIIMLLLVWLAYSTRSVMFTYCAKSAPPCGGGSYYNDPGDALANNPQIKVSEILFLNDNNQMFYRRVPKSVNCVPEANQIVHMKYPQYCAFSGTGISGEWKETAFNSNIYVPVNGTEGQITTNGNCEPKGQESGASGVPLLKWDENPVS